MPSITRSKLFAPEDVDNATPDTLLIVPANSLLINGRVRFVNHTAGVVTIEAWAVPSGGTAGDTNVMLPTTNIAANSYLDVDVPQMSASDFLQAQAGSATSITAHAMDGAYYAQ